MNIKKIADQLNRSRLKQASIPLQDIQPMPIRTCWSIG